MNEIRPGYIFNTGLADSLVPQLIKYSSADLVITRYTSDTKRFKDEKSYLEWREKGRTIFSLTNKEGTELFGIVWMGKEPLPVSSFEFFDQIRSEEYGITIAKRLYGEGRGKGMANDMMRMAFVKYLETSSTSEKTGFWAQPFADNEKTIKVNEFFGFKIASKPNNNGRILMVVSYDDLSSAVNTK